MLELTTAATVDPVTATEAKLYARIYGTPPEGDSFMASLVTAARLKFEAESGYVLSQATYTWTPASGWGLEMYLPLRPFLSLTSITTAAGTLTVNVDYTVQVDRDQRAKITFEASPVDPVFVFKAGFANPANGDAHGAPELAKLAIKALVAYWYNNREAYAEGKTSPAAASWESVVRNFRLI